VPERRHTAVLLLRSLITIRNYWFHAPFVPHRTFIFYYRTPQPLEKRYHKTLSLTLVMTFEERLLVYNKRECSLMTASFNNKPLL
jgi:hypothetical protein